MVRDLPKGQTQATTQVQAIPVEQELTLLRGFRDLVGERFGYFLGRRLTQQDMNEKTEAERKAVSEVRKTIKDNIPTWIKNADVKTYTAKQEALKTVAQTLTDAPNHSERRLAHSQKHRDTWTT